MFWKSLYSELSLIETNLYRDSKLFFSIFASRKFYNTFTCKENSFIETRSLDKDWLIKLNMQFIRENRKIILIVDNAGGHNLSDEFKKKINKKITNIRIEYLAPNCTSVIRR